MFTHPHPPFPAPLLPFPLAHPAADAATVHWLTVTEAEARAYQRITQRITVYSGQAAPPMPEDDPGFWLARGVAALEQASPRLVRVLREAASRERPVIVVRGLPAGAVIPPTPYENGVDTDASRQAIVNLHAVVAALGLHPIAYAGECASTLHAVCPVASARGTRSSRGFDANLPFHTDYADRPIDEPAHDRSPAASALAFAVERALPAVPMECVAAETLLAALSDQEIRLGQTEVFATAAPDIFAAYQHGGQPVRARRLFLSDGDNGFRCRLNLGKMTGLTPAAEALLRTIRTILSDESLVERIEVRRGDIVVMDNQRAIHRRAAFTPRWDDEDRYFIRMSTARDPRAGLATDPDRPWLWS